MNLADEMLQYFRGERAIGFVALGVGLLALGFAFWAWRTMEGSFGIGLAIPLLILGLGGALGGPGLVLRTDRQVEELRAMTSEQVVELERPRMAKVNANWPRLKLVWTALIVVALVLMWAVKGDWAKGSGVGLLLLCTILMLVDVFAERRAEVYSLALESATMGDR